MARAAKCGPGHFSNVEGGHQSTPTVVDEIEIELVVGVGRPWVAPLFDEMRTIERGEAGVTAHIRPYLGELKSIRTGQQRGVELGAADYEQASCVSRGGDGVLSVVENLSTFGVELRITRDDQITSTGQGSPE